MSTYYYMACDKCKKRSGISFTRQAWGWGCCYASDTFHFLIKHTKECGQQYIKCLSEHELYDYKDFEGVENCGYELLGGEEV